MRILLVNSNSLSVQPYRTIYIPLGQGQDEVPGPAFFVEIDSEDLSPGEEHFVEGEDHLRGGLGGGDTQPIGIPWEDGFLVLEAALGAALALHGEARVGQAVTDRRAVAEGNQQEENVILVEDILTEDVYSVAAGAEVAEFGFHSHKFFKRNGR